MRDALLATGWNKQPPAPILPDAILSKTRKRYLEIHKLLTGHDLP